MERHVSSFHSKTGINGPPEWTDRLQAGIRTSELDQVVVLDCKRLKYNFTETNDIIIEF